MEFIIFFFVFVLKFVALVDTTGGVATYFYNGLRTMNIASSQGMAF